MTPINGAAPLAKTLLRVTHEAAVPTADLVGVDLVNMPQFGRQLQIVGPRLRERLFSVEEREFCGQDTQRLASTLAGKEAVAKVLGTGFRAGVRWTDIEVLREPTGRPYARLSGGARRRASELHLKKVTLSLCHEAPFALAVAAGISAKARP
jgi:holo-[acyl-carrier protein] synthase